SIIEIASRTKEIALFMRRGQLYDPGAFFTQLDSLAFTFIQIVDPTSSLPRSYWKNFFNEVIN
ncbi:hypothetical protein PMAYCL1PPCAC_20889, partial [Pristionchus mayeri]